MKNNTIQIQSTSVRVSGFGTINEVHHFFTFGFFDRVTYQAFVTDWKREYAAEAAAQRAGKQARGKCGNNPAGQAEANAINGRVQAARRGLRAMLALRKAAKVEANRQWVAAQLAAQRAEQMAVYATPAPRAPMLAA